MLEEDTKKQEIEVEWEEYGGYILAQKLRFTGEEVGFYENGYSSYTLYECPDGYRIYENDDTDEGSYLHPNWINRYTGELKYGLYTAEKVAENYPIFGLDVGVLKTIDLD